MDNAIKGERGVSSRNEKTWKKLYYSGRTSRQNELFLTSIAERKKFFGNVSLVRQKLMEKLWELLNWAHVFLLFIYWYIYKED